MQILYKIQYPYTLPIQKLYTLSFPEKGEEKSLDFPEMKENSGRHRLFKNKKKIEVFQKHLTYYQNIDRKEKKKFQKEIVEYVKNAIQIKIKGY